MYINQINTLIKVMTKSELQQLKTEVESLLERETVNERESITTVEVCPFCGSEHIKKNGKSSSKQRYYCNECHKSFSETTNTFIFHSKVTEQQWISFIDYEIARLPLREEAHFLDLSVTTCYFMRHKLYQAVDKLQLNEKLENKTELDIRPAYIDILLADVPHVGIQSLRAGGGKKDASQYHKALLVAIAYKNFHGVERVYGFENGRHTDDAHKADRAEVGKPDEHDRSEGSAYLACTGTLDGKERGYNSQSDKNYSDIPRP